MRRPLPIVALAFALAGCAESGTVVTAFDASNQQQVSAVAERGAAPTTEPQAEGAPGWGDDPERHDGTGAAQAQADAPAYTPEQLEALAHPVFDVPSVPSWGSEGAPDDGSMGIWAERYYITHWWTPEGQAVLAMQPGQAFVIDGNAHLVEGVEDFDRSIDVDEVYAAVGRAWTFVQTCIPETDPPYVRVVYGR